MAVLFQQAHHQLAAGVGLRRAGIAACDHDARHAVRRMGLMLLMRVAGPMRLVLQYHYPHTEFGLSRSTGVPFAMCSSRIADTSASFTCAYHVASGYTTTVGPCSH